MDVDGEEGAEQTVQLTLANITTLTKLLQAIKVGAKQTCSVVITPEGVWIHWQDDSKTLRSSVQLRSELFVSYECGPEKRVFGVNYAQLVDTLSVFASASHAPLNIHYPGPDGELQLEMSDGSGDASGLGEDNACVLYARIGTLETDIPEDLTDYWAEPVSYFLVQGPLLKEAVDDLEWPGGPVSLRLARDPAAVSLAASGTGSLEVQLPAADLSGIHVTASNIAQRYNYKNLKAACSNIPDNKDMGGSISTKVSVDANGLLKVTHMIPLGNEGGARPAAAASMQHTGLSSFGTQAALGSSRVGVLQFVSMAVDEDD